MSALHPLFWVGGATAFGGIAWAAWYFSEHQRRLRALRKVTVSRIADAKEGEEVRITGTLRAHAPLLSAPLSGRSCAHFDLLVQEHVKHGKSGHWVDRFRDQGSCDFAIEDESGRALVVTRRLTVAVVRDHNQRSGTFEDATETMESILADHGMQSTGMLGFNRSLRYTEGVLEPGERVTVLGRARWEDDPEAGAVSATERGGYRTSGRKQRLVIEPGDETVRASDDPAVVR